jgi:hypothetical protein
MSENRRIIDLDRTTITAKHVDAWGASANRPTVVKVTLQLGEVPFVWSMTPHEADQLAGKLRDAVASCRAPQPESSSIEPTSNPTAEFTLSWDELERFAEDPSGLPKPGETMEPGGARRDREPKSGIGS